MAGTAVRSRPHNLPAELTSFVGRRRELSEVKRLLTTTRLLTLTGSGGAGKTRLALRAAADLARSFADGVWLIALAPLADPLLITQAVFSALGLQDMSTRLSLSALTDYLAEKRLLLVLDNCEHLLDNCAMLAGTLLKSCPELQILATSRQALGMTGELRMRVPPLSLPTDDDNALTLDRIASSDAVALLTERAAAVLPGFTLDASNAAAILRLCRRLDGMPLALELAAVRMEGLTVDQLLGGLERELPVMATGNRGAESRQRTLDATIGWSYGLLEEEERRLWARLAIFAGGFDEAAAVRVCSAADLPADRLTQVLASLVEKSIVQRDLAFRPPRYSMLETVRHYGRQRLQEIGGELEVQIRHCEWIKELALTAGTWDHRQPEMFRRVQLELDNIWTALAFCCHRRDQAEAGVAICFELWAFWFARGHLKDVRRILYELASLTAADSAAQGKCLTLAAFLASLQNDFAAAQPLAEESIRIGKKLGDPLLLAWASASLLFAALYIRKETEEPLRLTEPILSLGRSRADLWQFEAVGLSYVCLIRLVQGDLDKAADAGEAGLALCRRKGETYLRGQVITQLSEARRRRGDLREAEALAREGADGKYALGDRRGLALLVENLACMAADRSADVRAATLLGYAQSLRASIMMVLMPLFVPRHEACERSARGRLGDAGFDEAFRRGAAMSAEMAIAYILEQAPAKATATAARSATTPTSLTKRELEIAQLISSGLTTHQISAKLFISDRTVDTHVTNILNKLGLGSRIQLARWVAELGEPEPRPA